MHRSTHFGRATLTRAMPMILAPVFVFMSASLHGCQAEDDFEMRERESLPALDGDEGEAGERGEVAAAPAGDVDVDVDEDKGFRTGANDDVGISNFTLNEEDASGYGSSWRYVYHLGRQPLTTGDTDARHGLVSAVNHWNDTTLVKMTRQYVYTAATAKAPASVSILVTKKIFELATLAEIRSLVRTQGWSFAPRDLRAVFFAKSIRAYSRVLSLPRAGSEDDVPWTPGSVITFNIPTAVGQIPFVAGLADSPALAKPLTYTVEPSIKDVFGKFALHVTIRKASPLAVLPKGDHVIFEQEIFGNSERTGFATLNGTPLIVNSTTPDIRFHLCEAGTDGKADQVYDCDARL